MDEMKACNPIKLGISLKPVHVKRMGEGKGTKKTWKSFFSSLLTIIADVH